MEKSGIIIKIRKSFYTKCIAVYVALSMVFELLAPNVALALTSGPGQPEFSSFEPASTTDMVDLYSGDFTYNIPLLTVPGPNGGYPINIAYHSGAGMDEEASWVGLGWTLNVGAINRQLRGIPDDFNGETVTRKFHSRPDRTLGVDLIGQDKELFGFPQSPQNPMNTTMQISFNSFRGLGYRLVTNFTKNSNRLTAGLSLSIDPQSGIGFTPNVGIHTLHQNTSAHLSASINNRNGLVGVNFATNAGIYKHCGKKTASTDDKSFSLGASPISFSTEQSVPEVSMPISSFTIPFAFEKGRASTFGAFESSTAHAGDHYITGFYNQSKIKGNGIVSNKAYGYLHQTESGDDDMMDYNKSNIIYSKKNPNLAPSNFTYDIYNLTGQGIGGMFRPERSDVNFLHVTKQKQTSNTTNLGLEFGKTTPNMHVGIDLGLDHTSYTTGYWTSGTTDDLETALTPTSSDTYEPAYFKIYGERGGDYYNNDFLKSWYGDEAVRVGIDKTSDWLNQEFIASTGFVDAQTNSSALITASGTLAQKPTRQKRLKVISSLTEWEASKFGFEKSLQYYDSDESTLLDKTFNNSSTGNQNQISEISVFQEDGMRYTYGLPAFNNTQYDVNMSVPDQPGSTNLLTVAVGPNSYTDPVSGGGVTNQYLNRTELPKYVHSWMLTSIVSADYMDADLDGKVSDEDYGYWVKFNYTKKHDAFKWRVPYTGANFNEGNETDELDNTAYYTYGDKEIYYIKEIETKTHIAVFYLSEREDGIEAAGEYASSGQGTNHQYKLDKISLFVKKDYKDNPATAIPIQSVHFKYSYELCPYVPNNSANHVDEDGNTVSSGDPDDVNKMQGKLTLKKIYFTYQNSNRGALSPYTFDYGDRYTTGIIPYGYTAGDIKREYNPQYNAMDVDRWGNFKDNNLDYSNDKYPYVKFPYTPQDETYTGGEYVYEHPVGTWSLRKITLPTGGTMNIDYESDDYAFVEDKNAMQVFDIVGTDSYTSTAVRDNNSAVTDEIDNSTETSGAYKLYFRLDRKFTDGTNADTLLNHYVKDMTKIWYKVNVDLKGDGTDYETVSGYAEISKVSGTYGFARASGAGSGDYDLGFVSVKPVELNSTSGITVHPFQKAAWQYLRLQRPELVNNAVVPNGSVVSMVGSLMNAVFNPFGDVATMLFGGYYHACYTKGWAETIQLNGKSVIRLYEPDGKKYGGGTRVKKLSMRDNWTEDGDQATYGQEYFYDTNGDGTGTSTGVAYEPAIGAEESALRNPIEYSQSTFLGTAYSLYLETPLLEQFYPGPSVGYGKVTVKSIAPSEAATKSVNIENSAAPISIYEFYTPKDFPVVCDQTDMNSDPAIVRPVQIPGVYTSMKLRRARSQGYSVVLNDMAGKPKSIAAYKRYPTTNSVQSLINKTEYVYRTENPYNPNTVNKLDNVVQVLNSENEYQTAVLGQTFDIVMDFNETKDASLGGGLENNFEASTPPLFAYVPIPTISKSETSMKTSVTTKVIHRSGILKEVIVTTDQSKISTENLAYDINTGEPILTQVNNEYDDPVYSLNLPAYWYYDRMGAAYRNIGVNKSSASPSLTCDGSGEITGFGSTNVEDIYCVGDEVYVATLSADAVCTVAEVDPVANSITLIKNTGKYFNYSLSAASIYSLIIRRSGRRNLMTSPAGNLVAKSLTGFENAIKTSGTAFSMTDVIDATAVEYTDDWQTIFNSCYEGRTNQSGYVINPFYNGVKGIWRPKKTRKFVVDRLSNNNERFDGTYEDFVFFNWLSPSSSDDRWIAANEITKYSPFGFEVENKDALGVYSAAVYGYSQELVTGIAQNARYGEIISEGFEDYDKQCYEPYFMIGSSGNLVSTQSHTGNYSMQVGSSSNITSTTYNVSDYTTCASYSGSYGVSPGSTGYYTLQNCDGLGQFAMKPGEKYVVSVWVKQSGGGPYTTYTAPSLRINYGGTGTYEDFTPSGEIIEGWQRIYGVFTVPGGATTVNVEFISTGSYTSYFDDLRVHPEISNMVTYVYNPVTLKLEAQLDANNYATIYIYDEAGHLNKVKKETIRGIQTIKEGRISNIIPQ